MKKLGIIMAAIVMSWQMAVSQTHYDGKITVGGKAGTTLSRMQFNPSVPQNMIMGIVAGGSFRYIEENHFGLIAELNVEQRGWKEKYDGLNFNYLRRFTYLQLPMLTHIFFGNNHVTGFFNAGPEVGYMIAHSTSSNFDYAHYPDIEGFPNENRHNEQLTLPIKSKFDYGISAGMGMELSMGYRQSLSLEGRFYYGLRDVFSNHKADAFSGSSALSIMVTLGYNYRIK